jgi:nitrite reductase/ring-hydroxylating ferredoxin subunit
MEKFKIGTMNHSFRHSKLLFFSILFLLFLQSGCKKDDDLVPNVPVSISIYTTDPQFNDLNAVGGWIYLTGGSRGIVVYRFSMDEFMAYDRHCTYTPKESCALISVDQSGVIAKDDCCGSQFLLTDGTVLEGPASRPLKQYGTYFNGNLLRIFN